MSANKRDERLGCIKTNKNNEVMKVIIYNSANDMIVEFQDEWKEKTHTSWSHFIEGTVENPHKHKSILYSENVNNKGCKMKLITYNSADSVLVEFQDEYKAIVHTSYKNFKSGDVKNPYYPSVAGVGMIGNKYPAIVNKKYTIEYATWLHMLSRCYYINSTTKNRPTYDECKVCDEWLIYDNFYEWLHSQENFDKWTTFYKGALDKDILIKGNKIYRPEACCLVPLKVNGLFVKKDASRGNYPIGVRIKNYNKYIRYAAFCHTNKKQRFLGEYPTPEDAFYLGYKPYKEDIIN